MSNFVGLVSVLRRLAWESVEASKPVEVFYGRVAAVAPLQIAVDSRLVLTAEFLVVPRWLTDFELKVSTGGVMPVRNALAPGEKVLLLRMQGGQKFVVLDRVA